MSTITFCPPPLPLSFTAQISPELIEQGIPLRFFNIIYQEPNGIDFNRFFNDLQNAKENLTQKKYSTCNLAFLNSLSCSEQQKLAITAQLLEIALCKRWNPNDKKESEDLARIIHSLTPLLTLKGGEELGMSIETLSENRNEWLEQVIRSLARHVLEPSYPPQDSPQVITLTRLELMQAIASQLFPDLPQLDPSLLQLIANSETFAESFLYLMDLLQSPFASAKINLLNKFYGNFPDFTNPLLLLSKLHLFWKKETHFFNQELFEKEIPVSLFELLKLFSSESNEEVQASQFLLCLKIAIGLSKMGYSSVSTLFNNKIIEKLIEAKPEDKNRFLETFCKTIYRPTFDNWDIYLAICYKLLEKNLTISRFLSFHKNIHTASGKRFDCYKRQLYELCQPEFLEKSQKLLAVLNEAELEVFRFDDLLLIPIPQRINVLAAALETAHSAIQYTIFFNAFRLNLPLNKAEEILNSFPALLNQSNLTASRRAFLCLSRLPEDCREQFEKDCLAISYERSHPASAKFINTIYKYYTNKLRSRRTFMLRMCRDQDLLLEHKINILKIGLSLSGSDVFYQVEKTLRFLKTYKLPLSTWLEELAASAKDKALSISVLDFILGTFGRNWKKGCLAAILTACQNMINKFPLENHLVDFSKIFSYLDQTSRAPKRKNRRINERDPRYNFIKHFSSFDEVAMARILQRLPGLLDLLQNLHVSSLIPLCQNICSISEEDWKSKKDIIERIFDNYRINNLYDQKTLDKINFHFSFALLFSNQMVYDSLSYIYTIIQFADQEQLFSPLWTSSMLQSFQLIPVEKRLLVIEIAYYHLYSFPQLLPAYFTIWYKENSRDLWVNEEFSAARDVWLFILYFHNKFNLENFSYIYSIVEEMQNSPHILQFFCALSLIDDEMESLEIKNRLILELSHHFPRCLKNDLSLCKEELCILFSIIPSSSINLVTANIQANPSIDKSFKEFLFILMSNAALRESVFKRIEAIMTSSQVSQESLHHISKFVIDFHEELFLEEGHPLFTLCIQTLQSHPDVVSQPKNRYRIFSEHENSKKLVKHLTLLYTNGDDHLLWNLNLIRRYSSTINFVADDLPQTVSNQTLCQLFQSLEVYINQTAQEGFRLDLQIKNGYGLTFQELKSSLLDHSYIKAFLSQDRQGSERIPSSKHHLFIILQAILSHSNYRAPGKLSEQDEMLLKFSRFIHSNTTSIRDGLLSYHNLLPCNYKQTRSINKHKNPNKRIAYSFVIEAIDRAMDETIRDKEFLKELLNKQEILQEPHQVRFLINRFAKQIGLPSEILFDWHTDHLEDRLLKLTPHEFSTIFSKHFNLKRAHGSLCSLFDRSQREDLYQGIILWLKKIEGESLAIDRYFEFGEIQVNSKNISFWKLSENGATLLLKSMNLQIPTKKRKEQFETPSSKMAK